MALDIADELFGLFDNLYAEGICAPSACIGDYGPFTGIQNDYWTSFDYGFDNLALSISLNDLAGALDKNSRLYAWTVRPDNIASVPEPASLLLTGTGMLALAWSRLTGRRKRSAPQEATRAFRP